MLMAAEQTRQYDIAVPVPVEASNTISNSLTGLTGITSQLDPLMAGISAFAAAPKLFPNVAGLLAGSSPASYISP